jgi:hypothetical protein
MVVKTKAGPKALNPSLLVVASLLPSWDLAGRWSVKKTRLRPTAMTRNSMRKTLVVVRSACLVKRYAFGI